MTAQELLEVMNKVETVRSDNEWKKPYLMGTKRYINYIKTHCPSVLEDMDPVVIPDLFNLNGEYDDKVYVFPKEDLRPIKFEMGET